MLCLSALLCCANHDLHPQKARKKGECPAGIREALPTLFFRPLLSPVAILVVHNGNSPLLTSSLSLAIK
jgi:hypothetical protein